MQRTVTYLEQATALSRVRSSYLMSYTNSYMEYSSVSLPRSLALSKAGLR